MVYSRYLFGLNIDSVNGGLAGGARGHKFWGHQNFPGLPKVTVLIIKECGNKGLQDGIIDRDTV